MRCLDRLVAGRFLLLLTVAILVVPLTTTRTNAQAVEFDVGNLHVGLGGRAGVSYIKTGNTNFGAGFDVGNDGIDHNVDYAEGFLQPRIDLSFKPDEFGEFYAASSYILAATRLNGDPGGFSVNDQADADLGHLYGGWKSGDVFPSLGKDAVNISGGRQDFHVGDGFLIWDGNLDTHGDATYWIAPRTAFDNTAIFTLSTGPFHTDAFYVEGDKDQEHSELVGSNFEYTVKDIGTFGATYFNIIDSDDDLLVRKGMNVASVRAYDIPVPGVPALKLRGEYVREWGDDRGIDIDAYGWYAEAAYSFADVLPWSPTLSYRYSAFSGDGDPDDGKSTAFDALFYGISRGWGTWYQGEITGEYLLFNGNNRVHMVQINVKPTESLSTGIIYFNFTLDKPNFNGTPVDNKDFVNELNLYADWNITDHIYLGAVGGLGWANSAAEEVFGDDETYLLAEFELTVTY